MDKNEQHRDPDLNPEKTDDQGDTPRTGDDPTDIRRANENIRKSQGDDAGQRPTIDRHR